MIFQLSCGHKRLSRFLSFASVDSAEANEATRAEVRCELGQYLEAVTDFEQALEAGDRSPETYRLLAFAYDKVGDGEMAKQYRRIAESMSR